MSNELPERVAKLETKVERHEELMKNQISKNEDIAILRTLMERQDQRDERQNKQLESFEITMKHVNDNLSSLNSTQQQMKDDLNEFGVRVEKVEKFQHDDKEKNTIDLNGVLKKFIIWAIGIGLTALAFYFYILLGVR